MIVTGTKLRVIAKLKGRLVPVDQISLIRWLAKTKVFVAILTIYYIQSSYGNYKLPIPFLFLP